MPDPPSDINALKALKKQLKQSFTKLKTFKDKDLAEKTKDDIEVRLERLQDIFFKYQDLDIQLELADVDSQFDEIENNYFSIKSSLQQQLVVKLSEAAQPLSPHTEAGNLTQTNDTMLRDILKFQNKRCDALESYDYPKKPSTNSTNQHVRTFQIGTISCSKCSSNHQFFKCPQFKNLNPSERRDFVAKTSLCFNCLSAGHSSKKCKSKFKCHTCNKLHHPLLHMHNSSTTQTTANNEDNSSELNPHPNAFAPGTVAFENLHSYIAPCSEKTVILPTALVNILDANNQPQTCRLLLDSGLQASFISEECVQRLSLKRSRSNIVVHGLSNTRSFTTKGKLWLQISSRYDPQNFVDIQAHILNKLPAPQQLSSFKIESQHLLKNFQLVNLTFNISQPIDVLLGADYKILREGTIQISHHMPPLQSTMFGYFMAGMFNSIKEVQKVTSLHLEFTNLNLQIQMFWEIEEIPTQKKFYSNEELLCEKLFTETTTVNPQPNRYVVRLIIKISDDKLRNCLSLATSCFYSLEKCSISNLLQTEYANFMNEYHSLNQMELIPFNSLQRNVEHMHLPHHAVIKPSSTTTKVRVIFNGAEILSSGVSLNQRLLVDPKTQRDLTNILVTFRSFKYALVAYIEKMCCQILVHKEDRHYQRILWGNSTISKLQHFWLNTVIYGTSLAPNQATRILNQLTKEFQNEYPFAESAISNSFYLNDSLGETETLVELFELHNLLTPFPSKRSFVLRKWNSNSQHFLTTINGKKWQTVRHNLYHLTLLKIPRVINTNNEQVALHDFCKPSELSYAENIYSRCKTSSGEISTTTIAPKSKFYPIKQLSIQLLELCGAVLLTKLVNYVRINLNIPIEKCFTWTDSKAFICWLSANPRKLKSFIANRTSMSLTFTQFSNWNVVSRSLTIEQIIQSTIWWNGPSWLETDWKCKHQKTITEHEISPEVDLENREKYIYILHLTTTEYILQTLFEKFSKLSTIVSILIRCSQFIRECKSASRKCLSNKSDLNSEDVNQAYNSLLKLAQQDAFHAETHQLTSTSKIKWSSSIIQLIAFLDELRILQKIEFNEVSTTRFIHIYPTTELQQNVITLRKLPVS